MIILLAVLALVVVKALAESPWGVFTVGATIPIAMFMGGYLRFWRVGKVLEVIGHRRGAAVAGGVGRASSSMHQPALARFFSAGQGAAGLGDHRLRPGGERAAGVAAAGAARLPEHVHEAGHDLRAGARASSSCCRTCRCRRSPGSWTAPGLVVPGKVFPFCFITIACGAISGFHTLIASGTTPKIITRESYARPIGYGAMCLESLVAIMAMIAACTLEPGVYLEHEREGRLPVAAKVAATAAKVTGEGFPVTAEQMTSLAAQVGEPSLVRQHRRRGDAGGGHGADLLQRDAGPLARSLVSLRHHVRGAVHPDDD